MSGSERRGAGFFPKSSPRQSRGSSFFLLPLPSVLFSSVKLDADMSDVTTSVTGIVTVSVTTSVTDFVTVAGLSEARFAAFAARAASVRALFSSLFFSAINTFSAMTG